MKAPLFCCYPPAEDYNIFISCSDTPLVLSFDITNHLGGVHMILGLGMLVGSVLIRVWGGPLQRIPAVIRFFQKGWMTERGIISKHEYHLWKEAMTESNMGETRKIRVLVAKPGLDGHDRGAKVVARALRDAGMEVIYTGLRQTPEMIAEAALQEDVDVIGLSILSGAHMALAPRVLDLLKANDQDTVKVFIGGIIPDEDMPRLLEMGIVGVYGPGTLTDDIVRDIRQAVAASSPA